VLVMQCSHVCPAACMHNMMSDLNAVQVYQCGKKARCQWIQSIHSVAA
jgi:polyferredoxin